MNKPLSKQLGELFAHFQDLMDTASHTVIKRLNEDNKKRNKLFLSKLNFFTLLISFNTFLQEIFLLIGLATSGVIDTYFSDTNSKSFEISLGLVVVIYLMSRLKTGYNFLKTHD